MPSQGIRGTLYTVPNGSFYQTAGETVVSVIDTSGSIATLQSLINTARATNPASIITIQLASGGVYEVDAAALTLSSNMVLFGYNASIVASATSTARALILITDNSTNVSISNLTLDGKSRECSGVIADGISRCNIDQLTIRNLNDGIYMIGNGRSTYNNENTVTRCNISNCSSVPISIEETTQTVCMDNVCSFSFFGINFYQCSNCTAINNQILNCGYGIQLYDSIQCVVANNTCDGGTLNDTNGIALDGSSLLNKIVSNNIINNARGIYHINGSNSTIYDNTFLNNTDNFVWNNGVSRIITTSTALDAASQNYFYPPTVTNRHSSVIKNSTSRTDVIATDTTLSKILTTYRNAKASNPNNVIVMNLAAPVITGNTTITLSSNTCFVLSGSILLDSGVTAFSGKNVSYVSFSGGTLDGQNTTGRMGITLENCSYALIDQMIFKNFGDKNTRVTGSEPILLEGCLSPVAVGYCTIDGSAARGIWSKGGSQSTSNLIFTDNTISNVNMDGIDLDVTSSGMLAKFNNCNDNIRYGVFVEEGASVNHVIANTCSGNEIGFNVYSNIVTGTKYNNFIANKSISNQRGIRFGATTTKTTSGNFAFNNSITSCLTGINAQQYGSENYCSQHYFNNNTTDISDTASAVFFNSPFVSDPYAPWGGASNWRRLRLLEYV
jgi:parallel beta-helix repeat protein